MLFFIKIITRLLLSRPFANIIHNNVNYYQTVSVTMLINIYCHFPNVVTGIILENKVK